MGDLGEFQGHRYRLGSRLSAETQFHVSRRLMKAFAPASGQIITLLPAVLKAMNARAEAEAQLEAAQLLTPIMRAIGELSDEDAEYVIHACLGIVQREAAGGLWAPVWTRDAGYRFQDIDMPTLVLLTAKVIMDQYQSFFPGGLSSFLAQFRMPKAG